MNLHSPFAGLFLILALSAATKIRTPAPTDPHDISGVWFQKGYNPSLSPVEGGEPSFTVAGAAEYKRRKDAENTGNPFPDPPTQCWPHGVPRAMIVPSPMQIVQTPGLITMIVESGHNVRQIFMDTEHPKHLAATFMGHSVGRWEGDTLVVDTVGLNPKAWIDEDGKPESAAIHVVEHLHKINGGKQLEDMMTIDDPKIFTQPWTAKRVYDWRPDTTVVEYICEENNRDFPAASK